MSTLATPALSDAARHTLAAINAARHQPTPMLSAIAPGMSLRREGFLGVRPLSARAPPPGPTTAHSGAEIPYP